MHQKEVNDNQDCVLPPTIVRREPPRVEIPPNTGFKPPRLSCDMLATAKGDPALKRRSFIAAAAASGGLACRTAEPSPWRTLTVHEAAVLEAATECIIPADAGPGARQAQVVRYIDIQLTRRFKRHRDTYRDLVRHLDNAAQRGHGKGFAEISAAEQTALLAGMEKGPQKAAFDLLVAHTHQGFFGMPRHGGNADYAGWRVIGVASVPVRGRLHYQQPPEGK